MAMTTEQLEAKLESLEKGQKASEDTITKLKAEVQKETERANKAEKRLTVVSKLNAEDRELFDAMPAEEQETFLTATEQAQTAVLEKARIAKNKPPEIPEAVQKQLDEQAAQLRKAQDRAETVEKQLAEEKATRRRETLMKRAESDYAAMPGTPEEKADALGALDKLEKTEREGIEKLLAAGNGALAQLQKAVGSDAGDDPSNGSGSAWSQIEKLAKARATKDGIPVSKATDLVLAEQPELYSRYKLERTGQAS